MTRSLTVELSMLMTFVWVGLQSLTHAQDVPPLSTRLVAFAILNKTDIGHRSDATSFNRFFGTAIPKSFKVADTFHAIDTSYSIIDIPAAASLDVETQVKQPIANKLGDAATKASTTVFVLFGGHGGYRKRGGQYEHMLSMEVHGKEPLIERATLLQWLKDQNCRTTIFVTDTCADVITTERPSTTLPVARQIVAGVDLLLKEKGVLDVNSASLQTQDNAMVEQKAWADSFGGVFTQGFLYQLSQPWPKDAVHNWTSVKALIDQKVAIDFQKFKNRHSPGHPDLGKQSSQTPDWIAIP